MAVTELSIHCNFNNCRKSLTKCAWVTSCSHAFCEEDGNREFKQDNPKCPACNISLTKMYDVVQIDLNPSEEWKSMILAGLRPDILAEITNRAITFWNYQICHEHSYQVNHARKTTERLSSMEKKYGKCVNNLRVELSNNEEKLQAAYKEIEVLARRTEQLKDDLVKKGRQVQKVQQSYDTMRLSTLASNMQSQDTDCLTRNCGDGHISRKNEDKFSLRPKTIAHLNPNVTRHTPRQNNLKIIRRTPRANNLQTLRLTPRLNNYALSRFTPLLNQCGSHRRRGRDQGFQFRPVTPRCDNARDQQRFIN